MKIFSECKQPYKFHNESHVNTDKYATAWSNEVRQVISTSNYLVHRLKRFQLQRKFIP